MSEPYYLCAYCVESGNDEVACHTQNELSVYGDKIVCDGCRECGSFPEFDDDPKLAAFVPPDKQRIAELEAQELGFIASIAELEKAVQIERKHAYGDGHLAAGMELHGIIQERDATIEQQAAEIKSLKSENKKVIENAVAMIGQACEKHNDEVKKMSFDQFHSIISGRCHFCDIAEIKALQAKLRYTVGRDVMTYEDLAVENEEQDAEIAALREQLAQDTERFRIIEENGLKLAAELERLESQVGRMPVWTPTRKCVKPEEKVAHAFWEYWRENGETHKHGYYESTWGAINAAINAQTIDIGPHERAGCSPWNCWLKDGTKCTVLEDA